MDLQIGSTLYRNTNGVIIIEGIPQMTIELKKPEGPMKISYVGFDELCRVQVKLVDSVLMFNERRAHEVIKTPTSLELKNIESGKIVFHVELKDPNRVLFSQGEFLTMKTHLLQVSPTEWKVDRQSKKGGEIDGKGAAAEIG
jgi:hypothetical protein